MAWYKGGGGGITSDEVTAVAANVMEGTTALTSDSNDEIANGTLPLAKVMSDVGGTLDLANVRVSAGGTLADYTGTFS